jgi:hypothetical protein
MLSGAGFGFGSGARKIFRLKNVSPVAVRLRRETIEMTFPF